MYESSTASLPLNPWKFYKLLSMSFPIQIYLEISLLKFGSCVWFLSKIPWKLCDFLMSAPGFPRVRGVFWAAFRAGQSQGDCQKCLLTGACNLGDLIHDRCNMIYWLVVWNHEILWLSIYCIGNKNPNWKYQGNTRKNWDIWYPLLN